MSRHHRQADSRWFRQARAEFLAAHPTCWICGHHIPHGTRQLDHYHPISTHPHLAMVISNWRSAHGIRGCMDCPPTISTDKRRHGQPRRCNQARGNRPTTPPSPRSRRW